MTRIATVLLAILAFSSAFAGELAHKATYTAESLHQQGISSVSALIGAYAKAQSLELQEKSKPLFLINGRPGGLSTPEMDKAVSGARAIEVMTDGDAIVINVLT